MASGNTRVPEGLTGAETRRAAEAPRGQHLGAHRGRQAAVCTEVGGPHHHPSRQTGSEAPVLGCRAWRRLNGEAGQAQQDQQAARGPQESHCLGLRLSCWGLGGAWAPPVSRAKEHNTPTKH